jgi:DNA polymerase-3 subunit epsilon
LRQISHVSPSTRSLESLVRPSQPIPPEATTVHGISAADLATAPTLAELAPELLTLLAGAVFVAHNASFDLAILQHGLASVRIVYEPPAVARTLEAFRLLEPLAPAHNLEALCDRHEIALDAHHALGDALATALLFRLVLAAGLAPETVELGQAALWRLRSRGDVRPASEAQIRRVFALGRVADLGRPALLALVERVSGSPDPDSLTREQVQGRLRRVRVVVARRMTPPLRALLPFALALLLFLPLTAGAGNFPVARTSAHIAYAVDGDTVALTNGARVRLVQIDTSEGLQLAGVLREAGLKDHEAPSAAWHCRALDPSRRRTPWIATGDCFATSFAPAAAST